MSDILHRNIVKYHNKISIKACKNLLKSHLNLFNIHNYDTRCYHMLTLINNRKLTCLPRDFAKLCFDLDKACHVEEICYRKHVKIDVKKYFAVLNQMFPIILENSIIRSNHVYKLLQSDVIIN